MTLGHKIQSMMFGDAVAVSLAPHLVTRACNALVSWYLQIDVPELRAILSERGEFDSVEDLAAACNLPEALFCDFEELCGQLKGVFSRINLVESCLSLLDPSWIDQSHQPRVFGQAMRVKLTTIRSTARIIYNVPNHRPRRNQSRDRELWLKRRLHPTWTWGEFALRNRMGRGAVQLAYDRQAKREKLRAHGLLATLRALIAEFYGLRCNSMCAVGSSNGADYPDVQSYHQVALVSRNEGTKPIALRRASAAPTSNCRGPGGLKGLTIITQLEADEAAISEWDIAQAERDIPPARDGEVAIAELQSHSFRRTWALSTVYDARATEIARALCRVSKMEERLELIARAARLDEFARLSRAMCWAEARLVACDGSVQGNLGLRDGWVLTRLPFDAPWRALQGILAIH
jgi:hypothetical protein